MRFNISLIASSMIGLIANRVEAGFCRALAMSGGGSNGAWEAGVLWGFAHSEHPEDFFYDVVTGVSAGAINTAGIAGFAPEEVVAASEFLSTTWNSLTND
jgi:predicted acylesterase/phospholipase RssA